VVGTAVLLEGGTSEILGRSSGEPASRRPRVVGAGVVVDAPGPRLDSDGVDRALAVLASGAFLTLVLGVVGSGEPIAAVVLGAGFLAVGTVGFAWVRRRDRLAWSIGYVAVQLPLAYATFVADAGVGATLFLVVLVSQCVLLLPWRLVAIVIALVPFVHVGMPWSEGFREGLGTLTAVLFAAVVTGLLQREQQTRRELAAAHERLGQYAAQAERLAAEQERNRVARDIHDGLGHSLTVVQMQVKAARAVLAADVAKADEVLAKAQDQAEAALVEVRRSVRALREPGPPPSLPEALQALVEQSSEAGVATQLVVSGAPRPLPERAHDALFRVGQEGLTNVRKHARAHQAEVRLDYGHTAVRLEVRDDGEGAEPGASSTGFGVLGLRERAAEVGGRLQLESVPGRGSTLRVEVPV